jgi:hypothetical protein
LPQTGVRPIERTNERAIFTAAKRASLSSYGGSVLAAMIKLQTTGPDEKVARGRESPADSHPMNISAPFITRPALSSRRASKPPERSEDGWAFGSLLRERGAIHHDRSGPAVDVARQGGIRITPTKGWWTDDVWKGDYAGIPVSGAPDKK